MVMHELAKTSKVNKGVSSPDLLIFIQFHRHILKNRTMLLPTRFISASEKIGEGKSDIRVLYFFFFFFFFFFPVQNECRYRPDYPLWKH